MEILIGIAIVIVLSFTYLFVDTYIPTVVNRDAGTINIIVLAIIIIAGVLGWKLNQFAVNFFVNDLYHESLVVSLLQGVHAALFAGIIYRAMGIVIMITTLILASELFGKVFL